MPGRSVSGRSAKIRSNRLIQFVRVIAHCVGPQRLALLRRGFASVRCGPPRPAASRQQCAIASGLQARTSLFYDICIFWYLCVPVVFTKINEELLINLV